MMRRPYFVDYCLCDLPARILLNVRVHINHKLRIGEEAVLLLPTYLITSILSLMSMVNVETVFWVGTICTVLPYSILIRILRRHYHTTQEGR